MISAARLVEIRRALDDGELRIDDARDLLDEVLRLRVIVECETTPRASRSVKGGQHGDEEERAAD